MLPWKEGNLCITVKYCIVGFFKVFNFHEWPIFSFFIFTDGSGKHAIIFSRGQIVQVINICKIRGIYVPQKTNYTVTGPEMSII